MAVHRCPVCRADVGAPIAHDLIGGHTDRAGHYCPASFQPYRLTITDKRRS